MHPMTFARFESVFHGRLGGVKGLFVAYPDHIFDKMCCHDVPDKYMLVYRPSMQKYKQGPTMLEITGVSTPPSVGRLNQYFILLLLTLGVPMMVCAFLETRSRVFIHSVIGVRKAAEGAACRYRIDSER